MYHLQKLGRLLLIFQLAHSSSLYGFNTVGDSLVICSLPFWESPELNSFNSHSSKCRVGVIARSNDFIDIYILALSSPSPPSSSHSRCPGKIDDQVDIPVEAASRAGNSSQRSKIVTSYPPSRSIQRAVDIP